MAKKQRPLDVRSVELRIMGQAARVTPLVDFPDPTGVADDLRAAAGQHQRYVVEDWPVVAEVLPGAGPSWVGPMKACVILEASDVDRLLAGLRTAGWSPA